MRAPLRTPSRRPRSQLFKALRDVLGGDLGDEPAAFRQDAVARVVETIGRAFGPGGWLEATVRGFEHVPASPAMLVSNHSGGTLIPDVWGFAIAWYRHFGTNRPLHILGHELLFSTRASARFFSSCGVLRATPEVATEVLGDLKRDLLVLPGGDRDAWRPYRDRYRVNFAGRTGYARVAHELQVPVVPVAHAGAHETLLVLSSGERLARWAGLHRFARAEIWPVHLSLPWGLAIGPLPHFPLPARLRYLVGAPVRPAPLPYGDDDVSAFDERVREAIQRQLDELAAGALRR
ncbi:MAG: 1-acyl-sn-glycerol-3-phosphate acyltransferase [Myxococcaceae bacterium]|nr:1-acyl-sn-glycerol-3-phosphate acyltransferase [Myxococcaceae bacterium]